MHEAYQPVIDDGRGRFPEDLRVKAPRGARAAIAAAAQLKHTSHSEYVRQALLRSLEADGVKLRHAVAQLAKLKATTVEGLNMKAMVLAIAHDAFDDPDIWNEPLQKSITRDIRRMAA